MPRAMLREESGQTNVDSVCTCHRLSQGEGGPRAICGGAGEFVGTLQQIRTILVGEMWGLRFTMPQLSRGDWEQVSLD